MVNSLSNAITIKGWEYIYSKLFKLNLQKSIFFNDNSVLLPLVVSAKSLDIPEKTNYPKSLIKSAYRGSKNDAIGIKLIYSVFKVIGNNKLNRFFINNDSNITYNKKDLDIFISDVGTNKLDNIEIIYNIKVPEYIVDQQNFIDNLFTNIDKTNNISMYLGTGTYVKGSAYMSQPKIQIPLTENNFKINDNGDLIINVIGTNVDTSLTYTEFGIGYATTLQNTEKLEDYNNQIKQIYYRPFTNSQKFSEEINFEFSIKIINDSEFIFTGDYNMVQYDDNDYIRYLDRQLSFEIQPDEIGEFSYTSNQEY